MALCCSSEDETPIFVFATLRATCLASVWYAAIITDGHPNLSHTTTLSFLIFSLRYKVRQYDFFFQLACFFFKIITFSTSNTMHYSIFTLFCCGHTKGSPLLKARFYDLHSNHHSNPPPRSLLCLCWAPSFPSLYLNSAFLLLLPVSFTSADTWYLPFALHRAV